MAKRSKDLREHAHRLCIMEKEYDLWSSAKKWWESGSDRSPVYSKEFTGLNQRADYIKKVVFELENIHSCIILQNQPS